MLFFNELKRRHGMTSLLCVIFIQEQMLFRSEKHYGFHGSPTNYYKLIDYQYKYNSFD